MITNVNKCVVDPHKITTAREYVKLQHCVLNQDNEQYMNNDLNDCNILPFTNLNLRNTVNDNSINYNTNNKSKYPLLYFQQGTTFSRNYWHKRIPLKKVLILSLLLLQLTLSNMELLN